MTDRASENARRWRELGMALLPFADAASKELPLRRLLRLSLFQVSVGMAAVLLTGTLNRVMIAELGLQAWVVALMVALPLVFAPLDLATASFDQDAPARRIPSYDGEGARAGFTRVWAAPSGGLSIGARDLARLGRLLLAGGEGFVSPAAIARMETGETSRAARAGLNPYGLGLYDSRDETGVWTGHAGAVDSAQAEVFYNRRTGYAYALMVNTAGAGAQAMRAALRETLGEAEPAPGPPEDADRGEELPEQYQGVLGGLVRSLEAGLDLQDVGILD